MTKTAANGSLRNKSRPQYGSKPNQGQGFQVPSRGSNATVSMAPCKLKCYSVACVDMPHLEFGDKIVLPSKVLLELQCLKISPPMLFHIRRFATEEAKDREDYAQYCSVQEFSAPEGQMFIPYWMMQNLQIGEGDDVVIVNASNIPRGIYCRLQPEDSKFLEVAADIGPKILMESVLRRYSVLSVNETILIEYGSERFYVKVLDVKPASAVSLLGDVDLELDFAAPPHTEVKRPQPAAEPAYQACSIALEETRKRPETESSKTSAIPQEGLGRRLHDGVSVVDSQTPPPEQAVISQTRTNRVSTSSFAAAKQRIESGAAFNPATSVIASKADTDSLATTIKQAQGSFASVGHSLRQLVADHTTSRHPPSESPATLPAQTQEDGVVCDLCLAEVSSGNLELHKMRCSRNPAYHRFQCSGCPAKVFERDRASHLHCMECGLLCVSTEEIETHIHTQHSTTKCPDCSASIKRNELSDHQATSCLETLLLCVLCGFKVKRKDMEPHTKACSSRTERCDICTKYIKKVDMETHMITCISERAPALSTEPRLGSNQIEDGHVPYPLICAYCSKNRFTDKRHLKRHVEQECAIARTFRAPMGISSSTEAVPNVRGLVQGKLRRRADADLVSRRATSSVPAQSHSDESNQADDVRPPKSLITRDPLVRLTSLKPSPATARKAPKGTAKHPTRQTQLEAMAMRPPPPTTHDDSFSALLTSTKIDSSTRHTVGQRLPHLRDSKPHSHRAR